MRDRGQHDPTGGAQRPGGQITVSADRRLDLAPSQEQAFLTAVEQAVAAVLAAEDAAGAGLDITLVDDTVMAELNRAYRKVDRPTDVLAFAAGEAGPAWVQEGAPLGDLIISVDAAVRQAADAGVDARDELMLLTVHGTLHILGYDHGDEAAARSMNQRTAEILKGLQVELHRQAEADPRA